MLKQKMKKSPLTKAQNELLRVSLKRLLGEGLLKDSVKDKTQMKKLVLKDALNAIILE